MNGVSFLFLRWATLLVAAFRVVAGRLHDIVGDRVVRHVHGFERPGGFLAQILPCRSQVTNDARVDVSQLYVYIYILYT